MTMPSSPWRKVNYLQLAVGIMKPRMPLDVRVPRWSVNDIYTFAINSGEKSMVNSEMEKIAEVPPEAEEHTGVMQIMATQCCGLHSVSGFQYHARGKSCSIETVDKRRFVGDDKYIVPVTLKGFIRAIQKGYKAQRDVNEQVARENAQAHERWVRAGAKGHSTLPHPYYTLQPTCRPGLLLFTWNNKDLYEPGAQSLAEQIKAAGLGECTISAYARNPNSSNQVAAMVWALNIDAYDRYVKENDL